MEEPSNEKKGSSPLKITDGQQWINWKELIRFAILALVIVVPFRMYIAQPFIVSGASMSPTFETGQYLIIDEITYRFETPKRGDVIILKKPRQGDEYLIKRVIGLPGDTIKSVGGVISVKEVSGDESKSLNEAYVINRSTDDFNTTIGENEYFVMGDNRPVSLDSRFIGPVPKDHIVGRAILRLFPFNKIDLFPGFINN